MKTADLIAALAKDPATVSRGVALRRLAVPVVLGVVVAAIAVLIWLGRRSLIEAAQTFPFWMKATYTIVLAAAGAQLVARLSRPAVRVGRGPWLIVAAALVVMLVLATREFVIAPPGQRLTLWLGGSWNHCPFRILALSVPIFIGLVAGMRRLAPTQPVLAGAAAGFMAGALAATVYQLFCPETGAMFVVTWYTLGVLASTAAGAALGTRVLRW